MTSPVASRTVWALGKRDLRRYFANPTGYVFVTLFIFLGAAAAFWRPRFFLNNLANLDQLNELFPYLLLFFVPALSMGIWADERKQGTDELLLTLPASEAEIILGKYLAVLGIYTASVLMSVSHVLVLVWLGSPDPGLLVGNYLGYWLLGAALLPVAMLASFLTSNATIAFIAGALFCAVPVALDRILAVFSDALRRRFAPLTVSEHFLDFARGVVSLTGVLYFLFLATLFLYVTTLVLARRRAPRQQSHIPAGLHQAIRVLALAVTLASLLVLAARTHARLDLTAERMHSLSGETKRIVQGLEDDRPVLIQAFVSPDVPESYVQTRENMLDVLREIGELGGPAVTVALQETEPYTEQARLARERYGISPRTIEVEYTSEAPQAVFLGMAFTSGADEQVIPFLDPALSVEYEIARAIRVVSRGDRKRIGVIDSDTKIFGGFDFSDNQPRPPWRILDELRKQYEVVEIQPATPIADKLDALLVLLPSRLTQAETDLVAAKIRQGTPTMILVDPLTAMDVRLSPSAELAAQINPYRERPQMTRNYGDVRKMLIDLGINWVPARIAWDAYNPHPDKANLPRETVFVGTGNGNPAAFNPRHLATDRLQELLLLYPGYVAPVDSPDFSFEPLLQTGRISGTSTFFQVVRPTPDGLVLNPSMTHEPDDRRYVLAAQVRAKTADASIAGAQPTNVIVVADLDFISDYFFDIRSAVSVTANFDNINFFLNAMDVLAGDESFIALRNRRVKHRTLERVEARTGSFTERRIRQEQQAETDARTALEDARKRLQTRLEDIDGRRDLDAQAKQIMAQNLREAEERRLRVLETSINQEKNATIVASREAMEAEIRGIRGGIRLTAVLLPPVPVLLLGLTIYIRRERREREGARAVRRLRELA